MAVKVGELYAKLTLNDAEFKRKLNDSEKRMKDVAKATSAAFAAMAGSITAAAVAASNYTGEAMAVAKQTGLTVEAVQALGFAARRSEANLGLLASGLRALVRRAAEAVQGNEAFAAYFERIGISIERLRELLHDPEQLIMEVADALARLPTEAHASAAAMNVMSDAGRQLVPFLRQGSSAIRDLMRDAERLGLVMSGRSIRSLDEWGDKWETLRERGAALTRELAVEFLPTLEVVLNNVDKMIDNIQSLDEDTRRLIGTIGSGTLGAVGAFAGITTAIWATTRAMQALGTVFKLASGPAGWIAMAAAGLVSVYTGLSLARQHADALRQSIIQFGSLEDINAEIQRVEREIAETQEEIERRRSRMEFPTLLYPDSIFELMDERAIASLERRIADLEEQGAALAKRRDELIAEMARASEQVDLTIPVTVETPDESVAFQRWRDAIEELRHQFAVFSERLIVLDPAGSRRFGEAELLAMLQEELRYTESIIKASREALDTGKLLDEERKTIMRDLELAEARASALFFEILIAQEQLNKRLAEMTASPDFLEHLRLNVDIVALMFDLGKQSAEELLVEVDKLIDRLRSEWPALEGTVLYRDFLSMEQYLLNLRGRIEEAISTPQGLISVQIPRAVPEVRTGEERIQDILRRIVLDVEIGLLPAEDAIARVRLLQQDLLALVDGGLYQATEEQKRIWLELANVVENFVDRMAMLPSRLDQIRADYERAMGVGMEVESEIARALGGDFDVIAYEMSVRQQTVQALAAEEGTLTDEIRDHIRALRQLAREQQHLAEAQRLATGIIDAFVGSMGDFGRILQGGISFTPGKGFSVDWLTIGINAIALAAQRLFDGSKAMEEMAARTEQAAQAMERASRGWQEALVESQFHELLQMNPDELIANLRREIASHQHAIAMIEQRWLQFWNWELHQQQIAQLREQIREMEQLIEDLEAGWEIDIANRITQLLGVGTRDLQSAISGAFSAETAEEFSDQIEASLTAKVRNAFVTAFLESELMAPLFDGLGAAIRDAVMDTDITPGEIEGIREIMQQIAESSVPFWELLSEFGLLADTTERLNEQFGRLLNVPIGMRALQALRYSSATPQVVPTLAGVQSIGGGHTYIHIERVEPRDFHDFQHQMDQFRRREGLLMTGNPTGGRRRR